MKDSKRQCENLEKTLRIAYHTKEAPEVDELWHRRVMADIRNIGPLSAEINFISLLNQYMWRFVPVFCVLIFIVAAGIINLNFSPEYEIAETFMNDPIEFTVAQLLG